MASDQAHKELLNSLKRNYQVHRAIVCPRLEFFASACSGIVSDVTHERVVNLPDEDPTALEMMVHYLYHLDYSTSSTVAHNYTNDYATGAYKSIETHVQMHEHNSHAENGVYHEGMSDEAIIEEPSSAQRPVVSGLVNIGTKSKKNKKKQKKLSSRSISTAATELNSSPVEGSDLSNGTPCTEDTVVPIESPSPGNLVVHAKVYALSKKYNIHGLRLLALEKFRIQAEQEWDTGDFLLAAKEVYTSTSAADQAIRDAVTTIVYEHPEILDRDETQGLIKGLDLGFDVLKRVRAKGGFL